MADCLVTATPEGKWWCPDCDRRRKRLLPVRGRRNCVTVDPAAIRVRVEADLHNMADDARPWPDILATLDRCFGGCTKMDDNVGHCTLRGKSCTCRQRWIECILLNGCDYES